MLGGIRVPALRRIVHLSHPPHWRTVEHLRLLDQLWVERGYHDRIAPCPGNVAHAGDADLHDEQRSQLMVTAALIHEEGALWGMDQAWTPMQEQ